MINVLVVGLDIGDGAIGGIVHFNRLLLTYLHNDEINLDFFSVGKSPNFYHGKGSSTKFGYHLRHFKRMVDFIFEIKRKKISVVHINSNLAIRSLLRDGIFSLLAKLAGCKTCFFMHGWDYIQKNRICNNIIGKVLLLMLLEKQNFIGVSATQFKKELVELGIHHDKIFLFSTMVETEKYLPLIKKYSTVPFMILFCANPLKKEKGIYELLHAISLIVSSHSKIEFIIIGGGGENLDTIKKEADKLGICKYIRFTGYISNEEKVLIFQNSHILIFPSYTEGFPSTVLEAMAAGLPVIATPVGGIADAITDGQNGYILQSMPPESNEIASKVILLIENPALIAKMGKQNLKDVKDKHDVEVVTARIRRTYEAVYYSNR